MYLNSADPEISNYPASLISTIFVSVLLGPSFLNIRAGAVRVISNMVLIDVLSITKTIYPYSLLIYYPTLLLINKFIHALSIESQSFPSSPSTLT
jgi:hypothetical protein